MTVFCDCDGVLAHFNLQVFNLFGKYPKEMPEDDMWELIKACEEFWPTMPVKFGAYELWKTLLPYKPIVLTGCPKGHYEIAAEHKVVWVKKHFGDDVEVITCLSRNKPLHMKAPGDILIDDFRSNLRRWLKAGGTTVHYRTWEQAITDFKAVFELDETGT